jgi:putative membrane protein
VRENAMTDIPVLNALLFAGLGAVVFVIAFAIVVRVAPFDLWKEIVQERNVAAAIFAGAVALGLCWIIAAAMH